MFGPLGRGGAPQLRRSRRRIVLIAVALALAALIVGEVVDMVVHSSGPASQRERQSWLSVVAPMVTASDGLAPFLHDLRNTEASISRQEVNLDLGALLAETSEQRNEFLALRLPAPVGAQSELTAMFADRVAGVSQLATAVSDATGPSHDVGRATAAMDASGVELVAADRALRSAADVLRRNDHAALAWSAWIATPSFWSGVAVANFATALADRPALAASDRLQFIAVSSDPMPLRYVGTYPAITTTTTTTLLPTTTTTTPTFSLSTTTTSSLGITSTSIPTTTSTSTSLPLAAGFPQIPPAGVVGTLIAPVTRLRVIVVVLNGSGAVAPVTLSATLVTSPLSVAPSISSAAPAFALAPGASRYVDLPPLSVAPKASSLGLTIRASAPGLTPATASLQLTCSSSSSTDCA